MAPFPSLNFLQMLFSDRMFLRDAAEDSHIIKNPPLPKRVLFFALKCPHGSIHGFRKGHSALFVD